MVDQQDARAVLVPQRSDRGSELGHLRLREARTRLVEEDEPRFGRERTRDAEPPLVAVRKLGRRPVGLGGEAE